MSAFALSFFGAIEENALSVWVRESPSLLAFPFILFLHTLGLALLAGISVAIDVWLLGFAARSRAVSMAGFYKVMWLGFAINAVSGVLLLLAYPAKALTNPIFYAKMALVVLGLINIEWIKREVFAATPRGDLLVVTPKGKLLAVASLAIWAGTTLLGRLLAYTHTVLLSTDVF